MTISSAVSAQSVNITKGGDEIAWYKLESIDQIQFNPAKVYYYEPFDWTKDASLNTDTKGYNTLGDPIGTSGKAWARVAICGNETATGLLEASGLTAFSPINDTYKTIYNLQWGYFNFNDGKQQGAGFILPEIDFPEDPTEVVVSAKLARSNGEKPSVVVETFEGEYVKDAATVSEPQVITPSVTNVWQTMKFVVTVKKGTRIAIHSVAPASGNCRYYIDDICVTDNI